MASYRHDSQWLSNCDSLVKVAKQTIETFGILIVANLQTHCRSPSLSRSLSPSCSLFICHLVGQVTLPHDCPHYPQNAAKRETRLQFRCRSSCVFNCPNKCSSFSCSSSFSYSSFSYSSCCFSWFLFTLSSAIRCLRRHVLASCRRLLPHRFIATCSACDLS